MGHRRIGVLTFFEERFIASLFALGNHSNPRPALAKKSVPSLRRRREIG